MESPGEPKQYLVQRIREALAQDSRVSELEIDVTIRGGKVFLKGVVPTEERREAVATIARELLPDHEIHNETEVITLSEEPGVERLS